ncbi:class I SAM-dependent DNA methyltransferase [Hydrogenimonas sp.]
MGFDERAESWDRSQRRQALADAVTEGIRCTIPLSPSMRLLDVGAGTGLLTRRLLPHVGTITGVDSSSAMLEKFAAIGGDTVAVHCDILAFESDEPFDGIVSSMTIHHIERIDLLFEKLHSLLKPGGFLAVADLAPEEGTFHDHGNEGVYHFGFDEAFLLQEAQRAGFVDISHTFVHRIEKPSGRAYDIFLLTARTKRRG